MSSPITFRELFISKIDSCISFLSNIEKVRVNPVAMSQLPSFRDFKWGTHYIRDITPGWRSEPEATLNRFIGICGMKVLDFSFQEREKLKAYLDCFVCLVEIHDARK